MFTPQDWLKAWLPKQGERNAAAQTAATSYASFWWDYWVDSTQRSILFWDALRQRGNIALEHRDQGKPPVLEFEYEKLADGRDLERPVNYSLLRILPPEGVEVDPAKRPFVVIDPRAGHGPGIGGFKQDSQIGVALRAGIPATSSPSIPCRSRARRWATSAQRRPSSCAWSPSAILTRPASRW